MLKGLLECVSFDAFTPMFLTNGHGIGITKKWLEALKGDVFYPETFGYMIPAFQSLLGTTLSAESLRSLALYVTFAVHRPKENDHYLLRSAKSVRRPQQPSHGPVRRSTNSSTSPAPHHNGTPRAMTRLETGIKILSMYTDLLCGKDTTNIKKFARTVTNKVLCSRSKLDRYSNNRSGCSIFWPMKVLL